MRNLLCVSVALLFLSLVPTPANADCSSWQNTVALGAWIWDANLGEEVQLYGCENPDGSIDNDPTLDSGGGDQSDFWYDLATEYEAAYGAQPDMVSLYQFYVNCQLQTRDGSGGCGV